MNYKISDADRITVPRHKRFNHFYLIIEKRFGAANHAVLREKGSKLEKCVYCPV